MKHIGILNGPNLDRLGLREPEIYGHTTLTDVEKMVHQEATTLGLVVECFQSNHEGALIDQIADWADRQFAGLVINPGGLTHTSVALRDALAGCNLPTIEVHISNIYRREPFRHTSLTAPACLAVLSGLGTGGYVVALRHLANITTT
jgi:3-dehydroquinate dehydratase-2